tara:strand:+ start:32 stop:223 length:192 start_codon:yes stop_codon:yes gene_type:complete
LDSITDSAKEIEPTWLLAAQSAAKEVLWPRRTLSNIISFDPAPKKVRGAPMVSAVALPFQCLT